MIFDTCFIIDLMNNDTDAVAKLHELIKSDEPQLVTAVTIYELFSGMTKSNKPEGEKNKIMKVLNGQVILALDNDSAQKAGEIDGTLIKEGKMVDPIDILIAGITLTKKEKLLTRNIRDFSKVKGIELESY
ncbi:PIN domain-containing protein [Candidatus Woesearchaeota archaeon]|nr:PIN domain-containing protein [Candidatus Woesearchaeota archaeon]